MRKLFIVIMITFSIPSMAGENSIEALIRIEKSDTNGIVTLHVQDGPEVRALPQGDKIKKIMGSLRPGEEAFVTGKIIYTHVSNLDSQSIIPHFLIEEIKPISLKNLALGSYSAPELLMDLRPHTAVPSPRGIPISTEVASAITLTSSMLLMQNLSAFPNEPTGKADLQRAVLLSAGTLATLVFIYQEARKELR